MAAGKADFLTAKPTGSEEQLGGLQSYVAKPSEGAHKAAVLFLNDIHGWQAMNNRAFADALAAAGFLTVVPDFFHGDPAPTTERSKMPEWRERHPPPEVKEDAARVIAALRDRGVQKIGAIGFCWGGLHAAVLAGSTDLVAAAVINHGSRLTAEVVEAIQQPVQFNCAENDSLLPLEDAEKYRAILAAKQGVVSDFKIFPGQGHGWTVRPDPDSPQALAAAQEAFDRAVAFFKEYLQ